MSTISSKQLTAIAALLAGRNHKAAAKAAGVTAQSLSRWLHDADFVAELAGQRGRLTSQLLSLVLAKASAAVEVLAELAADAEKDSDRVRAAGLIVRFAIGDIGEMERESRFAELSARVEAALRERKQ